MSAQGRPALPPKHLPERKNALGTDPYRLIMPQNVLCPKMCYQRHLFCLYADGASF